LRYVLTSLTTAPLRTALLLLDDLLDSLLADH
jgi:hypothetical protein